MERKIFFNISAIILMIISIFIIHRFFKNILSYNISHYDTGIEQRPINQFGKDTGEKMDSHIKRVLPKEKDIVCCMTYPVIPDFEQYADYSFVLREECKLPCKKELDENGNVFEDCLLGRGYQIVDKNKCEIKNA